MLDAGQKLWVQFFLPVGLLDLKLLFFAVHTFFLLSYFFTDYPYHGIIWIRHIQKERHLFRKRGNS